MPCSLNVRRQGLARYQIRVDDSVKTADLLAPSCTIMRKAQKEKIKPAVKYVVGVVPYHKNLPLIVIVILLIIIVLQTWTNCILSLLSNTSLGLPAKAWSSCCELPIGLGGWGPVGGGATARLPDLSWERTGTLRLNSLSQSVWLRTKSSVLILKGEANT